MLQKLIDPNCIITNFCYHHFKNWFCQNKSDFNLKSSFLGLDFGHKGQSWVLARKCSVWTLYQSKLLKNVFWWRKLTFLVQHNAHISLVKLAKRSRLQSVLENRFLALKKKCFSLHLGQFFRCFEWKYCTVSENVFSMFVIYLHFSHCKFSLFFVNWLF